MAFKLIVCKLTSWFFSFALCIMAFSANAGVYQCVALDGSIEFRDSPCTPSNESENSTQSFLPIQYSKSDPKTLKIQNKILAKELKAQTLLENKEERSQQKKEKQRLKVAEKEKRRQMNCLRTQEKIKDIETLLGAGCKPKRFNRLKTELEHCERMKLRYCSP